MGVKRGHRVQTSFSMAQHMADEIEGLAKKWDMPVSRVVSLLLGESLKQFYPKVYAGQGKLREVLAPRPVRVDRGKLKKA